MKLFFTLCLGLTCLNASAQGIVKIYNANLMLGLGPFFKKGPLVLENGKQAASRKAPKKAYILNDQFNKIQHYYFKYHSRNSWDDKGSDIEATINIHGLVNLLGMNQNAAWIGAIPKDGGTSPDQRNQIENLDQRFIFGKGKILGLDQFEKALDVVAHEYTHAVIDTTSMLVYAGQSGALNEHLADVFGVLINREFNDPKNPYLIGSTLFLSSNLGNIRALRDMENPANGLTPQPGHMDDLKKKPFNEYVDGCKPSKGNDNCGVHILSGIPNKMAAYVLKNISTEDATTLFYNVMTKRLRPKADFAQYKNALLEECQMISAQTCHVVSEGLQRVGL